jgi:hypothetical protein
MPGMTTSIMTGGNKSEGTSYGSTAQERIMAAARARLGEGEEMIVGELEGDGIGDTKLRKEKASGLDGEERKYPSRFEKEEEEEADLDISHYTYDSDSSGDGDVKRTQQATKAQKGRQPGRHGAGPVVLQPKQLPIPPPTTPGAKTPTYLYDCQEKKNNQALESNDATPHNEYKLNDPPFEPPFLNVAESDLAAIRQEQSSWILMKFPTRLPNLHTDSTISGQRAKAQQQSSMAAGFVDLDDPHLELPMDTQMEEPTPDPVSSISNPTLNFPTNTPAPGVGGGGGGNPDASESYGYDDTLKDASAGRYGKIVMYKSGKAYLVVGGDDGSGTPPVRMQLTTGLPCGFLQQAVAIDPERQTYIPLGEVKKSLVVTPAIEEVFPS